MWLVLVMVEGVILEIFKSSVLLEYPQNIQSDMRKCLIEMLIHDVKVVSKSFNLTSSNHPRKPYFCVEVINSL
jgi:hypothetical protein